MGRIRGCLNQTTTRRFLSFSFFLFFFFVLFGFFCFFFFFFFALVPTFVNDERIHSAVYGVDGQLQPHPRFADAVMNLFRFGRNERDRRFRFAFDKPLDPKFAFIRLVTDVVAGVGRVHSKRQHARTRCKGHIVNFWPEDFGMSQLPPFGVGRGGECAQHQQSARRGKWQVSANGDREVVRERHVLLRRECPFRPEAMLPSGEQLCCQAVNVW